MKRRLNYTERKRITLEMIELNLTRLQGKVTSFTASLKLDELLLVSDSAPELSALLSKLYDQVPAVRVLPIKHLQDDTKKKVHVILNETVAPNIDLEELQRLLRA